MFHLSPSPFAEKVRQMVRPISEIGVERSIQREYERCKIKLSLFDLSGVSKSMVFKIEQSAFEGRKGSIELENQSHRRFLSIAPLRI